MDTKLLNTFWVIANLASFNKASEVLGLAQSTVSEQIKTLETDLDVKLFDRTSRQITLTPAGDKLMQYAQKIFNLDAELRNEIAGSTESIGALTIRIPETIATFYLPPIIRQFNTNFPLVELSLTPCSYYGLQEELKSGMVNLAFLITDSFRSIDLETEVLRTVPLVMVTYPENPLVKTTPIALTTLKNEPFYATTSDCDYFKIIDRLFTENKVKLTTILRISSVEAIKRNIIAGTGMALLTRDSVANELAAGTLVEVEFVGGPVSANMTMIWLKSRWQSPILKAFMQHIRGGMKCS